MDTHNESRDLFGGMGLARPMLNAMQADRVQNFQYRRELFSDLGSPILAERQSRKSLVRRQSKGSFDPQFSSNEDSRERRRKKKSSLRRAFSFSSKVSKKIALDFKSAIDDDNFVK